MAKIFITIEEQQTIIDLINHARLSINPEIDFFKKQREDLYMKLNNNVRDSRYKNQE